MGVRRLAAGPHGSGTAHERLESGEIGQDEYDRWRDTYTPHADAIEALRRQGKGE